MATTRRQKRRRKPVARVRESARTVPVWGEYDVCIAGGSCTGVGAAVAAARLGAKVLLIERHGFLGGVATAAGVNVWHSLLDLKQERRIIGGITKEIIDLLDERKGVMELHNTNFFIDTEELKWILDDLCVQSGVELLFHSWVADASVKKDRLDALFLENKDGRYAVKAKVFIDATGDGDLAVRAGCRYRKGRKVQPPTVCMRVAGFKKDHTWDLGSIVFAPRYRRRLKKGLLWASENCYRKDERMIAGTRVFGADVSDAKQFSDAEIEGRRQAREILDILRKELPGGKRLSLVDLPAQIGVRETRRVRCKYQLKGRELLRGKRFPDPIAFGTYPVDIHNPDGAGIIFRYLDGREVIRTERGRREGRWLPKGKKPADFYTIPFRSLISESIPNLLIAGRCIDTDQEALAAIRVMVNCNQTGHAAGVAAALAAKSKTIPERLPFKRIDEVLRDQKATIV